MRALIVAGAMMLAGAGQAQTLAPLKALPVNAKVLSLHTVGRMQVRRDGGHIAYVHQWPGLYFEGAFKGEAAYLGFDDPTNEYRLTVDGRPPVAIVKPGKGWFELGPLAPGEHRLRLEKVTESIDQTGTFDGIYIPASGVARPAPRPRKRSIEFIGASGEVGYGIRSTTVKCTKQEVHDLTDTQQAWTVLTAKHFDADYEINAISGRGLVRNYDGAVPGNTMTDIYPYTFYDNTVPVSDPDWQPDTVVVAEGGNDFSTTLKPGDKWKSQLDLLRDVLAAYDRMVVVLHHRYPHASVVLLWAYDADDPEGIQLLKVGRKSIETAATRAGLKRLFFAQPLGTGNPERTGCDYHGSAQDQKTTAQAMIAWLDTHPQVW